ncbi:hypothetical protein EDD22DRAFT_861112 [Suillus occidentalis]|nr:hypothetical protein EDD22DRAFT_861112 [Suillus occidentalis]
MLKIFNNSLTSSKMLAPFPVYLKHPTHSSPNMTTPLNNSTDNLLDIIDLFPFSATPSYEPPSRPPRNPQRLKRLYQRAHPPPTSPLPPLPPSSPDPLSQHLHQVPQQPMYPAPGGLSPWSAPLYPSKPIPTPPSPPQSNFILRGPVGQPLLPAPSRVRSPHYIPITHPHINHSQYHTHPDTKITPPILLSLSTFMAASIPHADSITVSSAKKSHTPGVINEKS